MDLRRRLKRRADQMNENDHSCDYVSKKRTLTKKANKEIISKNPKLNSIDSMDYCKKSDCKQQVNTAKNEKQKCEETKPKKFKLRSPILLIHNKTSSEVSKTLVRTDGKTSSNLFSWNDFR